MSAPDGNHVILDQLKRPDEAIGYVWAPSGDMAFAHVSQRLADATQEAIRKEWPTFKYALLRPLDLAAPIDGDRVEILQTSITLVIERFRHREHSERLGVRFYGPQDQQLYLEAYPHLAVGTESEP